MIGAPIIKLHIGNYLSTIYQVEQKRRANAQTANIQHCTSTSSLESVTCDTTIDTDDSGPDGLSGRPMDSGGRSHFLAFYPHLAHFHSYPLPPACPAPSEPLPRVSPTCWRL